ncbi:hypothetical protein IH992_09915 [Candidatus Poribacteria bacterium]|nr:hypothetical protein [Candidatus Poribacteria bacterium]
MNGCDRPYLATRTTFCQRENAKAPRYPPIKHLGGYRFGNNSLQAAGIVGGLQWHEVEKGERVKAYTAKCCPCYEVRRRMSRVRIVGGVGM